MAGHGVQGLAGALLLLPHLGPQIVFGGGEGPGEAAGGHLVRLIAAVGGGQQVGGQGHVEAEPLGRNAQGQGAAHHVLGVVPYLGDRRGQQAPEKGVIVLGLFPAEEKDRLPPAHRQNGQVRQSQHRHRLSLPLVQQGLPPVPAGDLLPGGGHGGGGLCRGGGVLFQAHLAQELFEAQLLKRLAGRLRFS